MILLFYFNSVSQFPWLSICVPEYIHVFTCSNSIPSILILRLSLPSNITLVFYLLTDSSYFLSVVSVVYVMLQFLFVTRITISSAKVHLPSVGLSTPTCLKPPLYSKAFSRSMKAIHPSLLCLINFSV